LSAEEARFDVTDEAEVATGIALLDLMIQKRAGKIINVCSLMSNLGRITTGPYTEAQQRVSRRRIKEKRRDMQRRTRTERVPTCAGCTIERRPPHPLLPPSGLSGGNSSGIESGQNASFGLLPQGAGFWISLVHPLIFRRTAVNLLPKSRLRGGEFGLHDR